MIEKVFGKDFHSGGGALTLDTKEVSEVYVENGFHERTHEDGWTISGSVREDYYAWVNEFEANHPIYGRVYGDFETTVYAESEEGFAHFYEHHTPNAWDYHDI